MARRCEADQTWIYIPNKSAVVARTTRVLIPRSTDLIAETCQAHMSKRAILHLALTGPHEWSGLFVQAAVMGGARGGPGGQAGQQAALGEADWEEVLNQLPQEAAAELRNAGQGEPCCSFPTLP